MGASSIVSIPHCPTVWNTNYGKILETGHKRCGNTFRKIDEFKKFLYTDVNFRKMTKNRSIYHR